MSDKPSGASNPREDEGIYIEHVKVSGEDAASFEPLRQTISEKTRRGWRLLSMVKDPAGASVRLVWEKGDRERHEGRGYQDEERLQDI